MLRIRVTISDLIRFYSGGIENLLKSIVRLTSSGVRFKHLYRAIAMCIMVTGFCIHCTEISSALEQAGEDESPLFLTPKPRYVLKKDFLFTFDTSMVIVFGAGCSNFDHIILDSLSVKLKAGGKPSLPVVFEGETAEPKGIIFGSPVTSRLVRKMMRDYNLVMSPEMEQEGYFLAVDSTNLLIAGKTPRARFYGLQTLYQLLKQYRGTNVLPAVSIQDWPLLPLRGIMDDISHGQVSTLKDFKAIIRKLAGYKINVYSPYIEDMIQFTSHPDIGKGRGALSKDEVNELVRYAAMHYVELIPTFQTLSHQENILLNPDYSSLAEFPGASTLNISSQETYNLLEDLVGEVASLFPSPYFHIGGNEGTEIGVLKSKRLVSEVGMNRLLASHYNAVSRILQKYNKNVLVFGDMILKYPDMIPLLSKNIWIVDWQYQWDSAEYPSVQVLRKAEVPFLICPTIHNFYQIVPDYQRAISNILTFIRAGYRAGTLGTLTASWNYLGGEVFRELNWFGYALSADAAWTAGATNPNMFLRNFLAQHYGLAIRVFQEAFVALWKVNQPIIEGWENASLIWNHPFAQSYTETEINKAKEIKSLGKWLIQQFEFIKGLIHKQKKDIDYLIFASRKAQWLGKKIRIAARVNDIETALANKSGSSLELKQEADSLLSALQEEILLLRDQFAELWLRTNKEEGLEFNLRRFDTQADYLDTKIRDLKSNRLQQSPLLPGEWIWSKNARSPKIIISIPDSALFRKAFMLDDAVKTASIQARCFSRGRVFINGEFIGEVRSRNPLSPLVWEHTVLVTPLDPALFRQGKNVIAVEGIFFEPSAHQNQPGLHACLTLNLINGSAKEIITDSTWSVSSHLVKDWHTLDFSEKWDSAVLMGTNYPNSRLERVRPAVREPVPELVK